MGFFLLPFHPLEEFIITPSWSFRVHVCGQKENKAKHIYSEIIISLVLFVISCMQLCLMYLCVRQAQHIMFAMKIKQIDATS